MTWHPGRKPKTTGKILKTCLVGDEPKTLAQIAEMAGSSLERARKDITKIGMSPEKFIKMERERHGRKFHNTK
jgi:hypothetical protein